MGRFLPFPRLLQFLMLVLALGASAPAFAQRGPTPAPARASQRVSIEMMVVYATNSHKRVDPRLRSLLPHLRHLNYSGYEVLDVRTDSLGPHQETTFSIVGGRRMQVELLGIDDRQARIRVRMFKESRRLLDTTVSIHRNRSFIVAGPHHRDGVLILPMTARY
ncbi:MAG: hypothetical protein JRI25_03325 [Deltaproteobacteria bacterium]|nr:hypothetical protein [Deltaproteobacteria bacterium]MBW2253616.1 hypothetical protein [Deltaproteobacteria bacterium]